MRPIVLSLALAACSTAPVPLAPEPGSEAMWLTTLPWVDELATRPGGGWGTGVHSPRQPIAGAECVASNDRGSWKTVTPGFVQVARSTAPLTITCRRDGYLDSRAPLKCLTPGERAAIEGAVGARGALAMGLMGLAILPLVVVAAGVDAAATSESAARSVAGDGPDCTYAGGREVRILLRPAGR